VIQAPTPAAPLEPTKHDQAFLAKLDELRDFDKAAAAVGQTRGLIEARASSNPTFRAALDDLCERRQIPRTRAPDAAPFQWTPALERQLIKRWIDVGLLHQARDELGISASDYHEHLADSSVFAAAIRQAEPLAKATLHELSTQHAARGNDKLLRVLEDERGALKTPAVMSPKEISARTERMLADMERRFNATTHLHRLTGEVIKGSDLEQILAYRDRRDGSFIPPRDLRILNRTDLNLIADERAKGVKRTPEELWASTVYTQETADDPNADDANTGARATARREHQAEVRGQHE
jgi:hypothetical protein